MKNFADYAMQKLGKMGERDVRKEYTRLRGILRKRAARLKGKIHEESAFYRKWEADPALKLKEIDNLGLDVRRELNQLARMVYKQNTTITALNKALESGVTYYQEEKGYFFVTKENYYEFKNYISDLKSLYGDTLPPSDELTEIYYKARVKKGVDAELIKKHFAEFRENKDILTQIPTGGVTIYDIRRWKYTKPDGTPYRWDIDV